MRKLDCHKGAKKQPNTMQQVESTLNLALAKSVIVIAKFYYCVMECSVYTVSFYC